MKITELNIPENHEGLMANTLRGFGQTVYLAGPNGSGKTRVLQFVKWAASVYKQPHEIARLRDRENEYRNLIKSTEAKLQFLEAQADSRSPENKAKITNIYSENRSYQINVDNFRQQQQSASHLVTESTEKPDVVDLSFSNTVLNDPRQQNLSMIEEALKHVQSNVSSSNAATHGLSAVTQVFRQYYAATHPDRQIAFSEHELKARKQDRDTLVNIVRDLVELYIEPNPNGEDPWIGGKPVTEARLSSGQKILLIAAMALHFQGGKLNNLVLLLDEPENHLHPGAAAEVIKRIRDACPNGQIWIATHSVHLLAQADANDIWFVKDGKITKGGSKTQEVLSSLLGGEEGQLKLATLLARPAEYAVSHFALQCLSPPRVADTAAGDKQTTQIRDALTLLSTQIRARLRVLDYGAGRGRLLSELHEFAEVTNQPVSELWDYYAFNPKDYTNCDVAQQCRDRIAIDFVDTKKRYFETVEDLDSGLNDKSVHVILLCNVLHEIDPREWLTEIQRFSRLLSDGGYLLIVEDQCLRDGETAHNYGFLVLDAPQLKILFGVPNEDAQIITAAHADEQYKDRLKAHLIPASLLPKVNSGTRASALKNLQQFAEGQAKRLRKSSCSLTNARRFAFWTQQHFNATCACNDFPL